MSENIKKYYIACFLCLFPLYTNGDYTDISSQKTTFFLVATCLLYIVLVFVERKPLTLIKSTLQKNRFLATITTLLLCSISCTMLLADNKEKTIFSDNGIFITSMYLLLFWGVLIIGSWSKHYIHAFSLTASANAVIVTLQVCKLNPLGLYPDGYSYFDAQKKYLGEYLGTVGNVDFLCTWLIMAAAICWSSYIANQTETNSIYEIIGVVSAIYTGAMTETSAFLICLVAMFFVIPFFVADTEGKLLCHISITAIAAGSWLLGELVKEAAINKGPTSITIFFIAAFMVLSLLVIITTKRQQQKAIIENPKKSIHHFWWIVTTLSFLIGTIFLYSYEPKTNGTFLELHNMMHGQVLPEYGSHRIQIWSNAVAAFKENPVLGYGAPFSEIVSIAFSRTLNDGTIIHAYPDNPHNLILSWLITYGLFGTTCFVIIIIHSYIMAWKKRTDAGRVCAAAMTMFLIAEMVSTSTFVVTPVFWVLAGLICSNAEKEKGIMP